MGFFTAASHPVVKPSNTINITADENYISKATRLPSLIGDYHNAVFIENFSQSAAAAAKTEDPKPTAQKPTKRFSFHSLFRRRSKPLPQTPSVESNKENIIPSQGDAILSGETIEPVETCPTIRNGQEIQIYEDEICSSLQVSTAIDIPKKRKSLRQKLRRRKTMADTSSRPTLRERFFRIKTSGHHETPLQTARISSSVYEARETLTQRYMNNNYDKLMDDLDAIPFDLTIKEETSAYAKFSKALQTSFSPLKTTPVEVSEDRFDAVSLRFKSTSQVEKCLETETWNPYDVAKKIHQMDSISITSSEYELTAKYNVKVGKQRPSRVSSVVKTFARTLTSRPSKKFRKVSRSTIESRPDDLSNESLPHSETNFGPLNGSESTLLKVSFARNDKHNPTSMFENKTSSSETIVKTTSESTEIDKNDDYNKFMISEGEDFDSSGSTKVKQHTSCESIYSEKGLSKAFDSNALHQNITANLITTSYNNENFASLFEKYSTENPFLEEKKSSSPVCKRSKSLKRVQSRSSVNPLNMNNCQQKKETEPTRPPTSTTDAFLKEMEANQKELDEIYQSIIAQRRFHKELINAPFKQF